jgi:hypothetical protein
MFEKNHIKILFRAHYEFFTLEILMFFPAFRACNTIFKGYFSFTTATKDSVKVKISDNLKQKLFLWIFFSKSFAFSYRLANLREPNDKG